MDKNSDNPGVEKLARLQADYHRNLPERLAEIRRCWQGFSESNDRADMQQMHALAHKLGGSAGTFGADLVGQAAHALEMSLQLYIEGSLELDMRARKDIEERLMLLENSVDAWVPGYQHVAATSKNTEKEKLQVYILEDDLILVNRLTYILGDHGYVLSHFSSPSSLYEACKNELPDVLIIDMILAQGVTAGADAMQQLRRSFSALPPAIFLSIRYDIEARLAAQRAGARRYFSKPVDVNNLLAALDGLTGRREVEPFRVLIVDDDEALARYYSTVLEQCRIQTRIITDPMQGLDALEDFRPELVLMDVYMEGCTGTELAAVIRQDDKWSQMPIVFLSSEANISKQLAALHLGGDEFIQKPVEPGWLAENVLARLKRARWASRVNVELKEALAESNMLRTAMEKHGVFCVLDMKGIIQYVNGCVCEISGYSRDELIGRKMNMLFPSPDNNVELNDLLETVRDGKVWSGEYQNLTKAGEQYWLFSTVVPLLDDAGEPYRFVIFSTDITPVKQAELGAHKSREHAEAVSRAKSVFLSNMSHELRTPLNAIIGFAQLMLMTDIGDEEKSYASEIVNAGDHLLALINDVLDFSSIEAGKADMAIESVSLRKVMQEAFSLIRPLADQYKVGLINCWDNCKNIKVRADAKRLKQCLLNLLSNACKYNRENGKVFLECEQSENGDVQISVRDTGVGIPEDYHADLFQPFTRLPIKNDEVEGAGIGLEITRRLVHLMGATIEFESEEDKGSIFTICFPWSNVDRNADWVDDQGLEKMHSHETSEYTVLYIEDSPANLKLVANILKKRQGIKLLTAHEPKLGLELVQAHMPDLVLLDINLPGMNGFEVLKRLRNMKGCEDLPVIAISADASENNIDTALNEGFNAYITKPLKIGYFLEVIDATLASAAS